MLYYFFWIIWHPLARSKSHFNMCKIFCISKILSSDSQITVNILKLSVLCSLSDWRAVYPISNEHVMFSKDHPFHFVLMVMCFWICCWVFVVVVFVLLICCCVFGLFYIYVLSMLKHENYLNMHKQKLILNNIRNKQFFCHDTVW